MPMGIRQGIDFSTAVKLAFDKAATIHHHNTKFSKLIMPNFPIRSPSSDNLLQSLLLPPQHTTFESLYSSDVTMGIVQSTYRDMLSLLITDNQHQLQQQQPSNTAIDNYGINHSNITGDKLLLPPLYSIKIDSVIRSDGNSVIHFNELLKQYYV